MNVEDPHRFRTTGLLGTDLEVTVAGTDADEASAINGRVVDHLRRLESTLSIYDGRSEISRWRSGEVDEVSPDVRAVVGLALEWQQASGGAFHPFVAEVAALWVGEHEPSSEALADAVERLHEPRLAVGDAGLVRLGDTSLFDANAVAKGWAIDQALDRAELAGASICIAAGGDLLWRGAGTWPVGIENPLRPYDNEPPLTRIELASGAIATSGLARRRLGATTHSHLIDPRSGRPATAVAGVSVIADCAASADAAATAAAVMDVGEALDWLATSERVHAGLVVAANGELTRTSNWPV